MLSGSSSDVADLSLIKNVYNLAQINTLLFLMSELIDFNLPALSITNVDSSIFEDFFAILEPSMKNSLGYSQLKPLIQIQIEALKRNKNYSDNVILSCWYQALNIYIQNHKISEIHCPVVTRYVSSFEKLFKSNGLTPDNIKQLLVDLLENLTLSKEVPLAQAIHTLLEIAQKVKQSTNDNKAEIWCSSLLFQILHHKNANDIQKNYFFIKLVSHWLTLPQFNIPFKEKYSALQLNNILILINHFMEPSAPQIIQRADEDGLSILKKELAPFLVKSYLFEETLINSVDALLTNHEFFKQKNDIERSIIWGHFLRNSFANSQLFDISFTSRKTFLKEIIGLYKNSIIRTSNVTMKDEDGNEYTSPELRVTINPDKAKKIFFKFYNNLLKNNNDVASAMHNFLVISRKVALIVVSKNLSSFLSVANAGVGMAFLQGLQLENRIDGKKKKHETLFFNNLFALLINCDQFSYLIPEKALDMLSQPSLAKTKPPQTPRLSSFRANRQMPPLNPSKKRYSLVHSDEPVREESKENDALKTLGARTLSDDGYSSDYIAYTPSRKEMLKIKSDPEKISQFVSLSIHPNSLQKKKRRRKQPSLSSKH